MSNNTDYNDLHTTGLGYLNRARTVTPENGEPYESVSISGLRGKKKKPKYTYYDTTVVGGEALEFITAHKSAINDRDQKLLVRFRISDEEPTSYMGGENKTDRRHVIKGRLIRIFWAELNGEVILQSTEGSENDQDSNSDNPTNNSNETHNTQDLNDTEEAANLGESLTESIELDRNSPDYLERKNQLLAQGYVCAAAVNGSKQRWLKKAA